MIKFYLSLFAGIFLATVSIAQPAIVWEQHYNGPPDYGDEAVSIAVDTAGNSYVTGSAFAANGTLDIVTIKYSPSGQQLWLQSFNGTGNDNDQGVKLVLDDSANVYVTGYSKGLSSSADITTIKYNSSGAQQWVSTYNGAFNGSDEGASIAVDPNGNVFVTGFETTANNFYYDLVTIMYDPSGNEVWSHTYNGPGNADDKGVDIKNDGVGNTYVVGTSDTTYQSFPNNDIVILKYDNAGTLQWRRVFWSTTYSYDIARRMCLDQNGNILICGYGGLVNQGNNFYTIKYNPAGACLWYQYYNYSTNTYEQPWDIIADSLGNVIVTGQGVTNASSPTNDYVTVKYNSTGVFQWAMRYDGPAGNNDYAYGVALDDSLNIFVTGASKGTSGFDDIATVKYDAAGNQKYVLRYNGTANKDDVGNDIAIHNSDIYITGRSANLANDDYVTLRYSYSAVGIAAPFENNAELNLYPNPSSGNIHLTVPDSFISDQGNYSYTISNELGQKMISGSVTAVSFFGTQNSIEINTTTLKSGVYFITLYSENGSCGNAKFLVK